MQEYPSSYFWLDGWNLSLRSKYPQSFIWLDVNLVNANWKAWVTLISINSSQWSLEHVLSLIWLDVSHCYLGPEYPLSLIWLDASYFHFTFITLQTCLYNTSQFKISTAKSSDFRFLWKTLPWVTGDSSHCR